jgi:hypothetical protein
MSPTTPNRLNAATIVSIALPAFALQSVVHEVLGHGVTAWLTGAKVVLISSTAMQTHGGSRLIPASGPLANLLFGVAAYLVFRRISRFSAARQFLWIFAFANLFLATGYILYSGLFNFGDSAAVISELNPPWLYRLGLVLFGAWGYRHSVQLAAGDLLDLLRNGSLLAPDIPRIVYPSCVAGSLLYIVASLFNPISPALILYDGVSEASGVAIGFVLLARLGQSLSSHLPRASSPEKEAPATLPFSPAWIAFASLFTVLFILVMGRGLRFPP